MDFTLEIITPRGIYLTEKVSSLTIKLSSGYRTILAGHTPLVGSVSYAPMHTVKNGKVDNYAIHGGVMSIEKERVVVVCNAIEHAKNIDVARAKASRERAEKRLKDKDSNTDLKRAELSLKRAVTRIQAADAN